MALTGSTVVQLWTHQVVMNGLFGLGVGAAFFLEALEFGHVAKVTILSATTPG